MNLTINPDCLSLRYNAACCIPLCVICAICERITRKSTLSISTNETLMSLADLADLRRQTPKTTIIAQTVFLCDMMQLAAFLCVICVICERIPTQEYSIYIAQMNPQQSHNSLFMKVRSYSTPSHNTKATLKLIISNSNCIYSTLFVHLPKIIKYDRLQNSQTICISFHLAEHKMKYPFKD